LYGQIKRLGPEIKLLAEHIGKIHFCIGKPDPPGSRVHRE